MKTTSLFKLNKYFGIIINYQHYICDKSIHGSYLGRSSIWLEQYFTTYKLSRTTFLSKNFLMPLLKIILSFVLYTLISLINPSLITVKLARKLDA